MIHLSTQERSIYSSLFVLLGTTAYFLSTVLPPIVAGEPLPFERLAPWILALFVILLAVELAFHITLNLTGRRDPRDERDALIEAKSARNAYYVLGGGLIALGFHAAAWQMLAAEPAMSVSVGVTLAVLVLAIAETTHLGSQLVYHRRGV